MFNKFTDLNPIRVHCTVCKLPSVCVHSAVVNRMFKNKHNTLCTMVSGCAKAPQVARDVVSTRIGRRSGGHLLMSEKQEIT